VRGGNGAYETNSNPRMSAVQSALLGGIRDGEKKSGGGRTEGSGSCRYRGGGPHEGRRRAFLEPVTGLDLRSTLSAF